MLFVSHRHLFLTYLLSFCDRFGQLNMRNQLRELPKDSNYNIMLTKHMSEKHMNNAQFVKTMKGLALLDHYGPSVQNEILTHFHTNLETFSASELSTVIHS